LWREPQQSPPNSPRAKSRSCTSFSLMSWGFSQRISPGGPNSQFHILLWHSMATAW
jgi:hypothetical protein